MQNSNSTQIVSTAAQRVNTYTAPDKSNSELIHEYYANFDESPEGPEEWPDHLNEGADTSPNQTVLFSKLYESFYRIKDLTNREYCILAFLAQMHYKTGLVYYTRETIAAALGGIKVRSVSKALTGLEKKGALTRHNRYNSSTIYKLPLSKEGSYAMIPDDVFTNTEITDGEFRGYVTVASFANRTAYNPPTLSEMARRTGVTKKTMWTWIQGLVDKGLITTTATERSAGTYTLTHFSNVP